MPRARPVVNDNGVNFEQLEAVVSNQLEKDAKYDREDAAKFRAVAQKVATYEEFENIVIGSHLKPMKEDVTDLGLKRGGWDSATNVSGRSMARSRDRALEAGVAASAATGSTSSSAVPTTVQAFLRGWRKGCADDEARSRYLHMIGAERIAPLFQSEMLGPFVEALDKGYTDADADSTRQILAVLSKTSGFGLATEFLTDGERDAVTRLFAKIKSSAAPEPRARVEAAAAPADPGVARRVDVVSDDSDDSDGPASGDSGEAAAAITQLRALYLG